jgi:hypothetical protein
VDAEAMTEATKSFHRAFTLHEEKGPTGAFKLVRVNGEMQVQCEVEVLKTRVHETREVYRTFRPAKPEDHHLVRIRSHK